MKKQHFKYSGLYVVVDSGKEEVKFRMNKEGKVCGGMKTNWHCIAYAIKILCHFKLMSLMSQIHSPLQMQDEVGREAPH